MSSFEKLAKDEKWEEIISFGKIALEAANRAGRKSDEANICAQLVSTSFYQGNFPSALEYAARCHKLSKEFEDPSLYIRRFT